MLVASISCVPVTIRAVIVVVNNDVVVDYPGLNIERLGVIYHDVIPDNRPAGIVSVRGAREGPQSDPLPGSAALIGAVLAARVPVYQALLDHPTLPVLVIDGVFSRDSVQNAILENNTHRALHVVRVTFRRRP